MKKSLFDATYRFTEQADTLDSEINKVLGPLYTRYLEMGYSPRDISHLIILAATTLEAEAIILALPEQQQ